MEIDDAYLGGEKAGKRGRGSDNKTAFVAAVQTSAEGKPLFMRLTPVAGFTHAVLKQWAANSLAPTAHVVSDGLGCFEAVTHTAAAHEPTWSAAADKPCPEFSWVNTLLGNLKTAEWNLPRD